MTDHQYDVVVAGAGLAGGAPVLRAVQVNLAHRRPREVALPLPRSGAHDLTAPPAPAPPRTPAGPAPGSRA